MNDNTINESSKTEDTDNENDEIIAVRNRLEKRPDGVVRQTISNAIAVLNNDPLLKGAIRRNELSCKTDIVKEMDCLEWKNYMASRGIRTLREQLTL